MFRRGIAAILVLGTSGAASAADLDMTPPPIEQSFGPRWEGFTFGGFVSGGWSGGQSASQSWYAPYPLFSSTAPTSFSVGGADAGVGAIVGYDKQFGQIVTGVMADWGFLGGSKSSSNYSGTITWPGVGWNAAHFNGSYSQQLESLGTARWRLGFAPNNDWLIYGDAGLAFGQTSVSSNLQMDNGYSFNGSRSGTAVGYAIGAGAEYAMGPNWQVGLDAFYYNLGYRDNVAVANFVTYDTVTGTILPSPQVSSRSEFSGFQLRLTALYQFDGAVGTAELGSPDPNTEVPITVGMRAGYSTGQTQMTLYGASGGSEISRLTYKNADSFTAEPFFDLEVPNWGLYVSGFAGVGQQRNGSLQDEDFPPYLNPYSSTSSSLQDGALQYGVLDVGYNPFVTPNYKVGGFIGYTFENDNYNANGCTQNASNPYICSGGPAASGISSNTLVVSDQFTWNAARLGISGSYVLPYGFTVSGNAAWLPYVNVSETDNHWLRMPGGFFGAIPGSGTSSVGYQLEAKVDYRILPGFDIGAGVRYWYLSAKGDQKFQDAALNGQSQPANWTSERLQAFLETGYHF